MGSDQSNSIETITLNRGKMRINITNVILKYYNIN